MVQIQVPRAPLSGVRAVPGVIRRDQFDRSERAAQDHPDALGVLGQAVVGGVSPPASVTRVGGYGSAALPKNS